MKPQPQVPHADSDSDVDLKRYASQRKAFHRGKADIRRFQTGKDDNLLTIPPTIPLSPRPDVAGIQPLSSVKVVPVPVPIPVPIPLAASRKGPATTPAGSSRIKVLDALDPHLLQSSLRQRDKTKTSDSVSKPSVQRAATLKEGSDASQRSRAKPQRTQPAPDVPATSREKRAEDASRTPPASTATSRTQPRQETAEERQQRKERKRDRRQRELQGMVAEALAHYYPPMYAAPRARALADRLHAHAAQPLLTQPVLAHAASAPPATAALLHSMLAPQGVPRSNSNAADAWGLRWPGHHLPLTPLSYSGHPAAYSPSVAGALALRPQRTRQPRFRLTAYCTCEAYDLLALRKAAKADRARLSQRQGRAGESRDGTATAADSDGAALAWEGLPMEGQIRALNEEVVMFAATPLFLSKTMFVFEHGCVCFFNFARAEESAWLLWLRGLERDPIDVRDRGVAVDTLRYSYWEPRAGAAGAEDADVERSVGVDAWDSDSSSKEHSSCPSERGSPDRDEDSLLEAAVGSETRPSGKDGEDDRDIADMGVENIFDEGPGEMEALLTADRDEPEESGAAAEAGLEEEPRFTARHNVVTLAGRNPLEKLACAFALSQAVKLNVFEKRYVSV